MNRNCLLYCWPGRKVGPLSKNAKVEWSSIGRTQPFQFRYTNYRFRVYQLSPNPPAIAQFPAQAATAQPQPSQPNSAQSPAQPSPIGPAQPSHSPTAQNFRGKTWPTHPNKEAKAGGQPTSSQPHPAREARPSPADSQRRSQKIRWPTSRFIYEGGSGLGFRV